HRFDGRRRQGVAGPHPRRERRGGPRRGAHLARSSSLCHRLSGQGTSAGEALVMARKWVLSMLPQTIVRTLAGAALLMLAVGPAAPHRTDRVPSPGGIEIWLVHEPTVPLIAMDFAFRGGASQDPTDKPGVASLVAGLIDEGCGDLASKTFHERLESKAIEISF